MDTRFWRLFQSHVAAVRKQANFSNLGCVGFDETDIRKGQQNISVFADLMERRVLYAAVGRDAGVWPKFFEDLEAYNGHRCSLQQFDHHMSPA